MWLPLCRYDGHLHWIETHHERETTQHKNPCACFHISGQNRNVSKHDEIVTGILTFEGHKITTLKKKSMRLCNTALRAYFCVIIGCCTLLVLVRENLRINMTTLMTTEFPSPTQLGPASEGEGAPPASGKVVQQHTHGQCKTNIHVLVKTTLAASKIHSQTKQHWKSNYNWNLRNTLGTPTGIVFNCQLNKSLLCLPKHNV